MLKIMASGKGMIWFEMGYNIPAHQTMNKERRKEKGQLYHSIMMAWKLTNARMAKKALLRNSSNARRWRRNNMKSEEILRTTTTHTTHRAFTTHRNVDEEAGPNTMKVWKAEGPDEDDWNEHRWTLNDIVKYSRICLMVCRNNNMVLIWIISINDIA